MDETALSILQNLNMTTSNLVTSLEMIPIDNVDDSVPCALIYDTDGQLVKRIDGGFTYHRDIVPLVKQLMAQSEQPAEDIALKISNTAN